METVNINMELITQLVASLGVGGVLAWYLWYNTTKTIPDIINKHASTIDTVTTKHENTISTMTTRFETSLKEERASRKEELESFKQWAQSDVACRYFTPAKERGNA